MRHALQTVAVLLAIALPLGADSVVPAKELQVAFVGDSLAYGAGDESGNGIASRLDGVIRGRGGAGVRTSNFGVTGATTEDVLARLADKDVRATVARADAIVVSAGANDLRRFAMGADPLASPLDLADEVLRRIDTIVDELRRVNPEARILILGVYNPFPHGRFAVLAGPLLALWDAALISRYERDRRISLVRLADIVDRPERLSPLDRFHPGAEAYQVAAGRVADLLLSPPAGS